MPGIYEKVARAEHIVVRALGLDGQSFTMEADGLLAVCIQHEMDHLKGRVFVEYLSRLKQTRIRAKCEAGAQKGLNDLGPGVARGARVTSPSGCASFSPVRPSSPRTPWRRCSARDMTSRWCSLSRTGPPAGA